MTAHNNTAPCIEFDDVVAGYKDFMILNNLSFTVPKGSITLLIGPNGAGKSTVLKTLFGLHAALPLCRKVAICLANFLYTKT
jgi:branched-chain amino acid transport system ATP-binding protein